MLSLFWLISVQIFELKPSFDFYIANIYKYI